MKTVKHLILEGLSQGTSWVLLEKIIRILLSLLINVLLARHFGVELFGYFNYVISVVTIFGVFTSMGINNNLLRDFAFNKELTSRIISNAILLKGIGIILTILFTLCFVAFTKDDQFIKLSIVIMSITFAFQSIDIFELFFQSQGKFKYISILRFSCFAVSSIIKIVAIFLDADLVTFAILFYIEFILLSPIYIYTVVTRYKFKFSPNWISLKKMAGEGWPLLLSSLMIMLSMRIDQIMIKQMIEDSSVLGNYSLAVRLTEIWYFIPTSILMVATPLLMNNYKKSCASFFTVFVKYNRILIIISAIIALAGTLSSFVFIPLVFGEEYQESVLMLNLLLWTLVLTSAGMLRSTFMIVQKLQKLHFRITLFGAAINITLNLLLIPPLGAIGAIIASWVSYFYSTVFSSFIHKELRLIGIIQLKTIFYNYK